MDDERSSRRRELSVTSMFLIWSEFTPSITVAIPTFIAALPSSVTLLASRPLMVIDAETDTVSDAVGDGEGSEVGAVDAVRTIVGIAVGTGAGTALGNAEGTAVGASLG